MPYLGFEPTASDTLSVFKYVATGSQTTFTGADANGDTLSYDVGDGSCQVWLNGVRLDSSDITATNGTSVVLAACSASDIVHIQATKAFIPADVVPKAAGGRFGGAVVAPSLTLRSPPLPVASGGTGAATHTANGALLGAGTGAVTSAAPGSSGNVLTSNGTVWASTAAAAGNVTDHPFVSVYRSAATDNVTGNGTVYTVTWDSELADTGSDFASNAFTAPSTGFYRVSTLINVYSMTTAATSLNILIQATGQIYSIIAMSGIPTDLSQYRVAQSKIIKMTASDTFTVTLQVAGESGDVVDLDGTKRWSGLDIEFLGNV